MQAPHRPRSCVEDSGDEGFVCTVWRSLNLPPFNSLGESFLANRYEQRRGPKKDFYLDNRVMRREELSSTDAYVQPPRRMTISTSDLLQSRRRSFRF